VDVLDRLPIVIVVGRVQVFPGDLAEGGRGRLIDNTVAVGCGDTSARIPFHKSSERCFRELRVGDAFEGFLVLGGMVTIFVDADDAPDVSPLRSGGVAGSGWVDFASPAKVGEGETSWHVTAS
jgi:hypothetical protein